MPSEPTQPEKLYYRIGEVSAITGVPSYVLRFWEGEFPTIKPRRTESGQRLYRPEDVERIRLIKDLLHRQKYTIRGARRFLRQKDASPQEQWQRDLNAIREDLLSIRKLLS
jgi:DNA-binding transcriptional MerR regulator